MKNPLFYETVKPIDSTVDRKLRLNTSNTRFGFSRNANLVPAVIDEFGAATGHLPIAFLPGGKHPAAVFVVGVEPGTNLYLAADGSWNGGYLPAYLRRYPFIVGDTPAGESLLCADHRGMVEDGTSGEPLFSDDGKPTAALNEVRDLAVNYKQSADRTDEFCAMLQELELLTSVSLNARAADGGNSAVHGLFVVDEAAFDALPAEAVQSLHEKRFLKPIIQHLASLSAINGLGERHAKTG